MTGIKTQVIEAIFEYCYSEYIKTGDENCLIFDNELVKKISTSKTFGNAFDVTKIDNSAKIPDKLRKHDYFIIHLGKGKHRFVNGISNAYHQFEVIDSSNKVDRRYRGSILNDLDTSESSILSFAANQKIINEFLYEDITKNPKVYNSRRTKCSIEYLIGNIKIATTKLQMEIDLTLEYEGHVTVFEGKNGFPDDFAIYQLFNPFYYYSRLKIEKGLSIKTLTSCYVLRKIIDGNSVIRLYLYTFNDYQNMASIRLIRNAEYHLIRR